MLRFLLGVAVGAAWAALATRRTASKGSLARRTGRVDELSSAGAGVVADPAVDAGDGTAGQTASKRDVPAVTP